MNRNKLVVLAVIALAAALFFIFDAGRFLTLESLKANRQVLIDFQSAYPLATVAAFMAIYIAQTALSLPGATIFSLTAGALFGSILGTLWAVVAATIGAAMAFVVTRSLLRDVVLRRFGHRLARLNSELSARGFSYLLFLRLVPIFPFFLINLAAGLTRLPLSTFTIATLIGIIPGAFVYVNAGASLASIDSLADIASPQVLIAFTLLGLFSLIPVLYSAWKNRTNGGKKTS